MTAAVRLREAEVLAEDSLLRIPLVRMMLEDPCVRFRRRAIDATWKYRGVLPTVPTGFNPALGAIFVGAESRLARWLEDPAQGARALNEGDALFFEVLFAVHDYLHVWAYRLVREAFPELGFGRPPRSAEELEAHAFCHIVTEAAATVGLDYWYLCSLEIDDVVDLGTTLRTLTVPYHDRFLREYRRACPALDPQHVSFFTTIVDVYCRGVFRGFRVGDVRRSPLVLEWMNKELGYGGKQRAYAREWLASISGLPCEATPRALARPCPIDADWQRALVAEVGKRLWDKVKLGKMQRFAREDAPIDDRLYDARPEAGTLDFRFLNAGRFDLDDPGVLARVDPRAESPRFLLGQWLAAHRYDPTLDAEIVGRALDSGSFPLVRALGRGLERVAPEPGDAPARMFFPG